MKVKLIKNLVIDDGGIPTIIRDGEGTFIPDQLMIGYETIRARYIEARNQLIDAYKKAGGIY